MKVLAHRVGLIPIRADPSKLDFVGADNEETDKDTLVFHYDVECLDQISGEIRVRATLNACIIFDAFGILA
jgi:DNA-directed RNA polymerase I and III subunit RPAC1